MKYRNSYLIIKPKAIDTINEVSMAFSIYKSTQKVSAQHTDKSGKRTVLPVPSIIYKVFSKSGSNQSDFTKPPIEIKRQFSESNNSAFQPLITADNCIVFSCRKNNYSIPKRIFTAFLRSGLVR